MISSVFYFLCFLILFFDENKGIKAMAIFGMAYICLENGLYWFFYQHDYLFDFTLYLLLCWFLEILFIFLSACFLEGWKKKLTLSLSLPLLFCQIIVMQYPYLIPQVLNFVITSSYQTSMEIYILCSSFKDTTIKEWIKTSTVLGCILMARLLPALAN